MKKVFLGGTCAKSTWRGRLIPLLKIDYFNPMVENWTTDNWREELRQRKTADFLLYVITPELEGYYSFSEVADDSNKNPEKTIFCCLNGEGGKFFNTKQIESIDAVGKLLVGNGGTWLTSLEEIAEYVNSH